MKIAVITAMDSEYNAINSLYGFALGKGEASAQAHGQQIMLIKSGIGKVNAALAAQKACAAGAELVITTGLAGGIDCSLAQGDVVLADNVCYHDVWCGEPNANGQVQGLPLYYPAAPEWFKKILAAAPENYFHTGLTVTGDQFLTKPERLKEIKAAFPSALAVDMESAAIAQTCLLNNCPYLSLRIVSDVVGKPGQEEDYRNFWQNVPYKAAEMLDVALQAFALIKRA